MRVGMPRIASRSTRFQAELADHSWSSSTRRSAHCEVRGKVRGEVRGSAGKMAEFTTLISGLSFAECPRWRDGRLYISDFYTHRVLSLAMDGTAETIAHVPQQPSGLGFLPDGSLLIVSMRDRKILRRQLDGSLDTQADVSALAPGYLNDMLVDRDGRAWVGNFGFDLMGGAPARSTVLICIEPDGAAKVVADDLGFPNGTALTPDGRTLIVAESLMNRLSSFNVDGGSLGERRTWAAFGDPPAS